MAKRKPPAGASGYDWIAEQLRPLAVEVGALTPDPANARLHGARNLAALQASLRRYGQRKPVVVRREGMIVTAGNGTLEAAKALGWTHVAAVLVDDDATTATGYAIADNRTAELAEWDGAVLAQLLGALQADEVPLEEVGFSDLELAALIPAGPDFTPQSGEGQQPLDKLAPAPCPHCGKDTREPPG